MGNTSNGPSGEDLPASSMGNTSGGANTQSSQVGVNKANSKPPLSGPDKISFRDQVSESSSAKDLYDAFIACQDVEDVNYTFDLLLKKLDLQNLKGGGLKLWLELKSRLLAEGTGLIFKQKKLLNDLDAYLQKVQKVVSRARYGAEQARNKSAKDVLNETIAMAEENKFSFQKIMICGAGPVGLRAAVELIMMGFHVKIIEKRPNFSRANILTFWDETMNEMLSLGAKSYFPSLQATGLTKFLGTRQIQVCMLKTFLMMGGDILYGNEIFGLIPPQTKGEKWRAVFRKYVKHARQAVTDKENEKEAKATTELDDPRADKDATKEDYDRMTGDFQKVKDYCDYGFQAGNEMWEPDPKFMNVGREVLAQGGVENCEFDAYVIAEGGWSDSTRKLGFSKHVDNFLPIFGLVLNLKYNPENPVEKQKTSQVYTLIGATGLPFRKISSEFVEYLKGETHFIAMTANARRNWAGNGLYEYGLFKKAYVSGAACMAPSNLNMHKLHELGDEIREALGLSSAEFFETNPIQLFNFSRRSRCLDSLRVLRYSNADGSSKVLHGAEYLDVETTSDKDTQTIDAFVCPVGDSLQEPNWTEGTGVNRGFHSALNQAFALLLAREKSNFAGAKESVDVWKHFLNMKWGGGPSGLAGSGTPSGLLKPFSGWDSDPRNRLVGFS